MSEDLSALKAIIARERASRKEAEHLLETKSLELYEKNKELVRSSEKYKQSNVVLSEIMATVPDGIILCTKECSIVGANQAASNMFDRTLKNLRGADLDEFMPGLCDQLTGFEEGTFFIERQTVLSAAGKKLPVEIRGHKGPVGNKSDYVLVFHDIRNRLQAEESRKKMADQVDEARRLEAIGTLSSGIAHEINTPIQFIGDNLEFLGEALEQIQQSYQLYDELRDTVSNSGVLDFTDEVHEINEFNKTIGLQTLTTEVKAALSESRDGIRQVRDIILIMKEFAHPGTGSKDEADINVIVRNVMTICRSKYKGVADIRLELDENLPHIPCRKGQIQQVILNLVINAVDAIAETEAGQGEVCVRTEDDGGFGRILISDTGPGVPEDLREKIFDPFFTTKPVGKGTGQGLALAKDWVINGHSGKLTLENIKGYNTTFVIALPLEQVETEQGLNGEENVRAA